MQPLVFRRRHLSPRPSALAGECHIEPSGVYATTPNIGGDLAELLVRTEPSCFPWEGMLLKTVVLDPGGEPVAADEKETAPNRGSPIFRQRIQIRNPQLWSLETPRLYTLVSELWTRGKLVDSIRTPFGIRTIKFTPDGLFLNGKRVQLNGVCDHHDLGCLGSAVHRRGIERQLEILKGMGCNAIRTSHNPPDPELLDLCDRMGFLVMDEAFDEWKDGKKPLGYGRFFDQWSEADLTSMIHRDRNHPCVVLWSIGNEIPEQHAANGGAMAKRLADICHREDPTRPVTSACSEPGAAERTGFAKALDVFGINYSIGDYQRFKGRTLVASETASALSTRGEYNLVPGKDGKLHVEIQHNHQVTSYDLGYPCWGYTAERDLLALAAAPWVAGEFVWTGFDYLGEPTPYQLALAQLVLRHRRYVRLSQGPLLFLSQPLAARAAGAPVAALDLAGLGRQVDPRLGGHELRRGRTFAQRQVAGRKAARREEFAARRVERALRAGHAQGGGQEGRPGRRRRRGSHRGQAEAARARRRSAADRRRRRRFVVRHGESGRRDGLVCPDAGQLVRFHLAGPGRIAGLDNGDPTDHESFQGSQHKVFHGLGLVVVQAARSAGRMTLRAEADGLEPAEISVDGVASP